VHLKCLTTDGYGPSTADLLIKALDMYFETEVYRVLVERIASQAPEAFLYDFVSPYASERKYGTHGAYYAGGNLRDQVMGEDGILVTKFKYGFDVIWYKPKDCEEDLLPDMEYIINDIFAKGDFLQFLKEEYPEYNFIQDFCDVVHAGGVTFPPTEDPTGDPTGDPTLVPSPSPTIQSTSGDTETEGGAETLMPTALLNRPAETLSPTLLTPALSTPAPTCPMCIVYPDDTEEDDCPIVNKGTCGDGERGDGICPFKSHCCSSWGYCGTTSVYCDDDSVTPSPSAVEGAPQSPTYAVDSGQCGGGNGNVGDDFCFDESLCCSDWGYCGSGENYCFHTKMYVDGPEEEYGTCGGGGVGDGTCMLGLCCSRYGFCGEGDLYCTGQNTCGSSTQLEVSCASDDEAQTIINSNPLPEDLKPEFGYRCGFSEVDARSNCKPECTHHVQCSDGEECWGVQLNYCNTYRELEHPVCTDLDLADNDKRCGLDEASARGHCGAKCNRDNECNGEEYCFPTLLNLCECHEETSPEASAIVFSKAKELISPYFVQSENSEEGKPRSASAKSERSIAASLLLVFASINILMT